MKRRFEFVRGGSAKFWEIQQNSCEVIVRFGRLGTPGQTQTKNFAVPISAQKHVDKMIGQKIGKGYVECITT